MRSILIFIFLFFIVSANVLAEDTDSIDTVDSTDSNVFVTNDIRGAVLKDDEYNILASFDFCNLEINEKTKYMNTLFSMVPLVKYNEKGVRYSFRFAAQLASLGMTALTEKLLLGGKNKISDSDARYLFYLPYSSFHIILYKKLMLTVGSSSEYLFYRNYSGNRGILYTPYVGFTFRSKNRWSHVEADGITFFVGYTRFFDFDRPDSNPGLTAGISIYSNGGLVH